MGLREDLLPCVQTIRDIATALSLRRFQAWVRLVTWSGSRVGQGTSTTTDTFVGRVKLRVVQAKDVVAGTVMTDALYELGPFTPEHAGMQTATQTLAVSPGTLSPSQTGTPTEIFFLVKGPGLPDSGVLCERVSDDLGRPFRYTVTVKAIGRVAT